MDLDKDRYKQRYRYIDRNKDRYGQRYYLFTFCCNKHNSLNLFEFIKWRIYINFNFNLLSLIFFKLFNKKKWDVR